MVMATYWCESRYNVNGTLVAAHGGVATPWNSESGYSPRPERRGFSRC
ncbi:MAG: hypothetical protein P8179_19000 [Candidatus Thiodiazotropha sp.]